MDHPKPKPNNPKPPTTQPLLTNKEQKLILITLKKQKKQQLIESTPTKLKSPRAYMRVFTPVGKYSRVKSEFLHDSKISTIMDKYRSHGIPPKSKGAGSFVDNFVIPGFTESLNQQSKSLTMFEDLDANLRKEFDNNPAKLMDFLEDPKNKDRAIELGLIDKPPEATAQEQYYLDKLAEKKIAAKAAKTPKEE